MRFDPHPYQREAVRWLLDRPRAALFLDMGLGKSAVALTALSELIDAGEVSKALVIAPRKVAESTWTDEAAKWDHLRGLRVVSVTGDARRREAALNAPADAHVIGRDCLLWLCRFCGGPDRLPYDCYILDELTTFKNHRSTRHRLAYRMTARARVWGLTGTPAPNGLLDLWGQMRVIDRGERLGGSLERYRDRWFVPFRRNNIVLRCPPKPGAAEGIAALLKDICLGIGGGAAVSLPPVCEHTVRVALPPAVMRRYAAFERARVMEIAAGAERVTAANAAALLGKLCQFANGAVYGDTGAAVRVHSEKAEALAEIAEQAGSPVLVFYQYRHDLPPIMERLAGRRVRLLRGAGDVRDWNAGEIDVLLAHPASAAYGLNMQAGGRYVVWYGTGWDLELYLQGNARLHRQGQEGTVHIYRLVCAGTADERALAAINGKRGVQETVLSELRLLLDKHAGGTRQQGNEQTRQ